jgi:hypothetical protein
LPCRESQRDDRAAEAAASHARTDRTGSQGRGDDSVECGSRHLVVVTQTGVARREDGAKHLKVASLERSNRLEHALVLVAHVSNTARVAGIELAPPVAVAGSLEAVAFARVDDHDRELFGQRDPAMHVRSAVQE